MRGGGFSDRAARCLSLLLYSPAQDGKHITCFPLRAELATNLNSGRPGLGIRRARRGNVTCQKGTGLFWSVLSGETSPFTMICFLLQHVDQQRFRKCGEKSQTSKQTDIIDNKTAVQ